MELEFAKIREIRVLEFGLAKLVSGLKTGLDLTEYGPAGIILINISV